VSGSAPLDAGLDFDRRVNRRRRRGERQILRGIVPRIDPQQGHQVAEALDEGRRGFHAAVLAAVMGDAMQSPWAGSTLQHP
jgi:hypothetical protein